jgi:hypothetical protein
MTEQLGMLSGERVLRIHWIPGSDTLLGTCHCGAHRSTEEPVELWDWLLAHPEGHERPPGQAVQPRPAVTPRSPIGVPA